MLKNKMLENEMLENEMLENEMLKWSAEYCECGHVSEPSARSEI